MHVITYVSGDRYVGFVEPFLHSVLRAMPEATVHAYCDELSTGVQSGLRALFPEVRFVPAVRGVYRTRDQKVSFKIVVLQAAMADIPDGADVAFLDSDTLVLKNLSPFFEPDFDVAFTWKKPPVPLNTGVMLFRNRQVVREFLREYATRTAEVLADPERVESAMRVGGGVDQAVLMGFLPNPDGGEHETRLENGELLKLYGWPCTQLNQTECGPVVRETAVVHYKAGWHSILLQDAPFSAYRPRSRCAAMAEVWRSIRDEGIQIRLRALIAQTLGRMAAPEQSPDEVASGEATPDRWLSSLADLMDCGPIIRVGTSPPPVGGSGVQGESRRTGEVDLLGVVRHALANVPAARPVGIIIDGAGRDGPVLAKAVAMEFDAVAFIGLLHRDRAEADAIMSEFQWGAVLGFARIGDAGKADLIRTSRDAAAMAGAANGNGAQISYIALVLPRQTDRMTGGMVTKLDQWAQVLRSYLSVAIAPLRGLGRS